jgi:hypothetical protein
MLVIRNRQREINSVNKIPDMKTQLQIQLAAGLALCATICGMPGNAPGQIYVVNYAPAGGGSIGEYSLSGAPVNTSLVTGLTEPYGLALSGGDLYEANIGGTIGEYNAATGAVINSAFISGFTAAPFGVAASGGNLFITSGNNTVGEYNAATGAPINSAFISGLSQPSFLTVSGGDIWVAGYKNGGLVGEYNATTGAAINPTLVSGLGNPWGVAVFNGNLYVADRATGRIGEYNAITGAPINPALVSGLNDPWGLVIAGGNIYVTTTTTVGEYNATTGAPISPALVSGLTDAIGLVVQVPEPAPGIIAGLGLLAVGLDKKFRRR